MSDELPAIVDQQPGPGALLEAVIRAASNPDTDADKLEKLLAIGRQLELDRAKAAYDAAFYAMKPDVPDIGKYGVVLNKGGKKQFSFLRWDDLHRGIRPALKKHGFATSFNFEEPEPGRLTCILELSHVGGYSKFYRWTLPSMGQNQYVSNLQNAAAARSFAKRCVLIDALDVLAEDTDRDGSDTPPPERITEEQARKIEDALAACEQREQGMTIRFYKWLRAEMQTDKIRELFQGAQHDSVTSTLQRKMAGLGIK